MNPRVPNGARRILIGAALGGVLYTPGAALAMDLAEAGSWSVSVSSADLVAGAGSGLVSSKSSATSEVLFDVTLTAGDTDNWRIDVRRTNSVWDATVKVWVRRTGSGGGTGSIANGLSWAEVGTTDIAFFDGAGDRSDVPVQLRITGISLSIAPDAYLTTLEYTLIDTL